MYKTIIRKVGGYLPIGFSLTFLIISSPVQAFQFDDGPIGGNIDTTLSFGTSSRVQARDKDLVCTANGGNAYSCNSDDGNLNYDTGPITQVLKITSDIELNHKNRDIGAFFRLKGFIDNYNDNTDDVERALSDDTIDLIGKDFKVLDAYGWGRFDIGGRSAEIRVGSHVLNWGESTFIQGGNNAINPIDAAAIRLPGAELREALLPVPMISFSTDLSDNLSLEAFYQLDWEKTIPDPAGSYLSVNDFGVDGGRKAVVSGFGDIADEFGWAKSGLSVFGGVVEADLSGTLGVTAASLSADEDFLTASRAGDDKPKDSGQWGISLRYFSEELNDTEFGFYYMNYHSRLPIISAKTGTAAGVLAAQTAAFLMFNGGAGATWTAAFGAGGLSLFNTVAGAVAGDIYYDTANYFIEYPEDIGLLGVSFNTSVGLWALQGEYSYKHDVPLQIDDVELLLAAATPISSIAAYTLDNQITNGAQLGTEEYVQGYIRRNVSQAQVTGTKIFSNVMGADQFVFVAEAAVTRVHNMPSKNTLRLNGPGTSLSGNPNHDGDGLHDGKGYEDAEHFPDATSWGYRLAGRWTFNNAYNAVNLQPRVAFQHDVNGVTPGPGGNFIEGRKALTLGLGANYKNQWSADVSYTSFFGAGDHNLINDRDFIAFNLKYSF